MRCFFLKEIIKREEVKDTLETINSQYGKNKKKHKNTGCATTYNSHYKATNISNIDATHPPAERRTPSTKSMR